MTESTTDQANAEFTSLVDVADELGHDHAVIPRVTRQSVTVDGDQQISVLVWGTKEPELAFLHGGAQNAHTWDLVALELGRPAIAIDLPGHGHSSWRTDRDYGPRSNATVAAVAIERLAPNASAVVGMSLGGLTTIALAATRPDLVRRAILVDVTPGSVEASRTMTTEQRGATVLTRGPRAFSNLEDMVTAAVHASPRRPPTAVRRGVIHNTKQLPDGTWAWRYDLRETDQSDRQLAAVEELWDDLATLHMPCMLVKGGDSVFVTAGDCSEVTKRLPATRIEEVPGAGHAVQSDQPKALAALIRDFMSTSG
jgi:esterase